MELSYPRAMDSRPFDKMPNEVLLHIFVKGTEDDPDPEEVGNIAFRRLKPFAALTRQVCARWRIIIDYHPSYISFFFARLILRPGWLNERREITLAKQLAIFRRQLLSSGGCNLFIYLNFSDLFKEGADHYASDVIRLVIRLVMHAMAMLLPYHNQVAGLVFYHCPSEISIPLLKLIATRWMNASRLATVDLGVSHWKGSYDMRRMIMNLFNLHVYDRILPQTSIRTSSQLSLRHFPNLDTLIVPARLSIDGGLLLPSNLQRLTLVAPHSQDGLPKLYYLA